MKIYYRIIKMPPPESISLTCNKIDIFEKAIKDVYLTIGMRIITKGWEIEIIDIRHHDSYNNIWIGDKSSF